jgi:hypothetical protein
MEYIKLPEVEIPKRGLYDWFLEEIAEATKMSAEEVKQLFNL